LLLLRRCLFGTSGLARTCLPPDRSASPELYTRSLHDALPIYADRSEYLGDPDFVKVPWQALANKAYAKSIADQIDINKAKPSSEDRKSTRLNSSHVSSSYAVFCLKKKNNLRTTR